MRLIIVLSLLSLVISNVNAQKGWSKGELVFKNGDTLRGYISLPVVVKNSISLSKPNVIKFRKNNTDKKEKYTDKDVQKVIFRRSETEVALYEFVSISTTKKSLFKIVTTGRTKLYARYVAIQSTSMNNMGGSFGTNAPVFMPMSTGFSNFNEYYILMDNEEIAKPLISAGPFSSFKQKAIKYFRNCPELVKKIKDKTYRSHDIAEIVWEYDNCKE